MYDSFYTIWSIFIETIKSDPKWAIERIAGFFTFIFGIALIFIQINCQFKRSRELQKQQKRQDINLKYIKKYCCMQIMQKEKITEAFAYFWDIFVPLRQTIGMKQGHKFVFLQNLKKMFLNLIAYTLPPKFPF